MEIEIMANSYYIYLNHPSCNNLVISNPIVAINKFLQITVFSAYLVYLYKFSMNVCAAQVSLQY